MRGVPKKVRIETDLFSFNGISIRGNISARGDFPILDFLIASGKLAIAVTEITAIGIPNDDGAGPQAKGRTRETQVVVSHGVEFKADAGPRHDDLKLGLVG